MTHTYRDGRILVQNNYFSDTVYHVSNECISVIFNGKGGIAGYALANEADARDSSLTLFHEGTVIDPYTDKTVEMIGRSQTVTVHLAGAELKIEQFLDASVNGVFTSYELIGDNPKDAITVCFGLSERLPPVTLQSERELVCEGFCFGASADIRFVHLNSVIYFSVGAGERVCTFLSLGGTAQRAMPILKEFDTYERRMREEIATVRIPPALTEEQHALFLSAYFCSLQNFKCHGEYRAFMAGHHYLLPMRSYYRDSYYTVLPMYREHIELVKEQLLTLAMGISENGDCPSAVRADYSKFWGNHYDSPSFFVMMLYDYVTHSGDTALLRQTVRGEDMLQKAENVLRKLSAFADETSLIYKEGPYNQRDWADEVNRNGYVTYNEVLYARALFCLSRLCSTVGAADRAEAYMRQFEQVKKAINDIPWDENLGYYVNFKEADFVETNLSIDTCLAALFGIADDGRARRMLEAMEKRLETRNNTEQRAGDYGVMCVYPFYSRVGEARNKSAQPYYYHNGGNWPYFSAMYAAAKRKYGMEYHYALESWFDYNVARGNYTPWNSLPRRTSAARFSKPGRGSPPSSWTRSSAATFGRSARCPRAEAVPPLLYKTYEKEHL